MSRLTNEQLEKLREFDSPTICNALEVFGAKFRFNCYGKPGMVQRSGSREKAMIGYAVTAKVSSMAAATPEQAQLQMDLYAKNRENEEPSIICIQDTDKQPIGSYWGEVQATVHKSLGAVGTLVQGGVRDIPAADELGFYFMSTVGLVSHAFIHVEQVDCPVVICDQVINPGDLIHADIHGFVIIPEDIAPKLYEACVGIAAAEMPVLEPCRKAIADGVKPSMDDLGEWRRQMAAARKAVKVD